MAVFTYQARDARGELVTGTVNAESAGEASRSLRAEGKYVLDLTPGVHRGEALNVEAIRTREAARRVRREEVIEFCHQLSIMLETGVPLGSALEAYNSTLRDSHFGRIADAVREEVMSGSTLSAALARWPKIFPGLVVSLIKASEASGTLGMMLGRISQYLNKELKTGRQIRGALTYPCVMMTLAVAVTVFLLTVVLPRFATIYANRSAALPAPTRFMLGISSVWNDHWPLIVAGAGVAAAVLWRLARRPAGRRALDWVRLNTPIVGPMYRKLYLTRSCRTLATLIVAGVELLEAIKITRGVTDNVYFDRFWDEATHRLEDGARFSEAIRGSDLMPVNVGQMIVAGEQSGRLGQVLERIGAVSEEELDQAVEKATQYIEPLMIGFMGVVVGFVAIALLLPIFTISKVMS